MFIGSMSQNCPKMANNKRAGLISIAALYHVKPILHVRTWHEKQRSSQRKYREPLSNLPSHQDNATHQGISISQPCYEDKCMEWYRTISYNHNPKLLCMIMAYYVHNHHNHLYPSIMAYGARSRLSPLSNWYGWIKIEKSLLIFHFAFTSLNEA